MRFMFSLVRSLLVCLLVATYAQPAFSFAETTPRGASRSTTTTTTSLPVKSSSGRAPTRTSPATMNLTKITVTATTELNATTATATETWTTSTMPSTTTIIVPPPCHHCDCPADHTALAVIIACIAMTVLLLLAVWFTRQYYMKPRYQLPPVELGRLLPDDTPPASSASNNITNRNGSAGFSNPMYAHESP